MTLLQARTTKVVLFGVLFLSGVLFLVPRGFANVVHVDNPSFQKLGGPARVSNAYRPLQAADMADRANRAASDFVDALGDVPTDSENLFGLLTEKQVIIAGMRSTDMPMEVFRLEIQGVNVC